MINSLWEVPVENTDSRLCSQTFWLFKGWKVPGSLKFCKNYRRSWYGGLRISISDTQTWPLTGLPNQQTCSQEDTRFTKTACSHSNARFWVEWSLLNKATRLGFPEVTTLTNVGDLFSCCHQINYHTGPLGKTEYLTHDSVPKGPLHTHACVRVRAHTHTHSTCLEWRPSQQDAIASAYFLFGVRLEMTFSLQI